MAGVDGAPSCLAGPGSVTLTAMPRLRRPSTSCPPPPLDARKLLPLFVALLALLQSGFLVTASLSLEVDLGDGRRAPLVVEASSSLPQVAGEFCHQHTHRGDPEGPVQPFFSMNECIHILSEALEQASANNQGGDEGAVPASSPSLPREPPSSFLSPSLWEDLDGAFGRRRARDLRLVKEGKGVLLYLHLKKCGGMTVQDFLSTALRGWGPLGHATEDMRWFFNHGEEALRAWNQELFASRVVADHFPYGFHALLAPRPYAYMTMLRSPRDRLFSYYNYLRVASDWEAPCPPGVVGPCTNNWWPQGLDKNATITAWLDRQLRGRHYLVTHVDNYQTRMLCGAVGMKTVGPAQEDLLLCALHNLQTHFAVVGVTERMEESLCVMSSVLLGQHHDDKDGSSSSTPAPSSPAPHINYNQFRHLAPDHPHSIPEHYVRYDEILYQYATSMLETRLQQYPQCRKEGAPSPV